MSVIRVDNFGPSAGGTTYSARGIAKAWGAFSNTATAVIDNSLNISSITDNGAGDASFGISSGFSSVAYTSVYDNANNAVGNSNAYTGSTRGDTKTASSFRCVSVYDPGTTTGVDGDNQSFVCVGDLA